MSAEVRAIACFLVAVGGDRPRRRLLARRPAPARGHLARRRLGGIGVGIVLWAKRFMPRRGGHRGAGPTRVDRARRSRPSPPTSRPASGSLARRRLLAGLGRCAPSRRWASALLFPIRSLGPRPGGACRRTPYAAGAHAGSCARTAHADPARRAGRRRRRHRVPRGPHRRRRRPDPADPRPHRPGSSPARAGRTGRSTASSPTRSSAPTSGCPVGLYQADDACCCARATSRPSTCSTAPGPCSARRPGRCPSCPLGIDDEGYVIATGDFSGPVGPRLLGPGPADGPPAPAARPRLLTRPDRPLARRPARRRQVRPHRARQGLPRPLVVHARRARALLASSCWCSPAST